MKNPCVRRVVISFAVLAATSGVAGCGRGPTAPSATLPATSATPPRGPAPTILSITPTIGSTDGGASIVITGTGLVRGLRVTFGATNGFAAYGTGSEISERINVTTPRNSSGSADVVVTNPDGQRAVAIGAYTFADPESFDVNGNWGGFSFNGDDSEPFTFTVVNGAVVSITCATSGVVTVTPPAPIIHGQFSFGRGDEIRASGRIVAPNEATGGVNVSPGGSVSPCVNAEWHANKK